jgi:bacteriocin biosynthesis cyclodehydratase domain-containing protein
MYRLHPGVRIVPLGSDKFQLRGPDVNLTVEDADGSVRSALEGSIGLENLEEKPGTEDGKLKRLAFHLNRRGLLVADERGQLLGEVADDALVTLDLLRCQHDMARKTADQTLLRNWQVQVIGAGQLARAAQSELSRLGVDVLAESPIRAQFHAESASEQRLISVVCCDCEDHKMMRDANRELLQVGLRALYACVTSRGIRIGPVVIPGQTACYECFYQRLRNGMEFLDEFDAFVAHQHRLAQNGLGPPPALAASMGGALVALQAAKLHMRIGNDDVVAQIVELQLSPLELRSGEVLRLPRCGLCGAGRRDRHPQAIYDRRLWKSFQ